MVCQPSLDICIICYTYIIKLSCIICYSRNHCITSRRKYMDPQIIYTWLNLDQLFLYHSTTIVEIWTTHHHIYLRLHLEIEVRLILSQEPLQIRIERKVFNGHSLQLFCKHTLSNLSLVCHLMSIIFSQELNSVLVERNFLRLDLCIT